MRTRTLTPARGPESFATPVIRRAITFSLASFFTIALGAMFGASTAEAQYKNGQIGFDVGYFFLEADSGLDEHAALVALRGAYKASDHWWFTARAGVSFRGEQSNLTNNTVVLFHLQPIDARYYFLTDRIRPFLGVTTAFTFLANHTLPWTVGWAPGVDGGIEIRLRRDLYLGFEIDTYYNLIFEGDDHIAVTATSQLLFFL